jgi:thiol reductant ABC exporter CydD subunit
VLPLTRIVPRTARALDRALAVSLGTLAGALFLVQAAFLSRAVDAAFLERGGLDACAPLLLAFAGAALVRATAVWGQEVLAQRFSGRVRLRVRDRLVRRLLALGPRFASGERTGELANTLIGGVEALDAYLGQYLPQASLAALVPALVLLAVLLADPLSALVLLLTFPLVPLFVWLLGSAARQRTRRQWLVLSRLSAAFLDALQGLPTLKAFGQAEASAEGIAAASDRYRQVTLRVLRLAFVSALVLEGLATLGTAVVAVEVGLRLLYSRIVFTDALFVLVVTPEFYRPLRALGASFHAGLAGREAAARIAEVLKAPGPLVAPAVLVAATSIRSAPVDGAWPSAAFGGGRAPAIAFEDVRFAYAPGRPPALDGLSLRIDAGLTLALVGPTGAGKTTVAHLLLRFLEPDAGTIRIDGEPLSSLSPEDWRRRVAWVPQNPRLFHGSVLDNLLLARPGAPMAAVEHAASLAHVDTFVRELPRGWETPVGEGGERLAGGQAQRVALARAFLEDAPVLVLDEPTAQLDPEHEAFVVDAIERLRCGRTVLLIAHRITTVMNADRIALLSRGRVVEEGTHRHLLAHGHVYPHLVAAWRGTE